MKIAYCNNRISSKDFVYSALPKDFVYSVRLFEQPNDSVQFLMESLDTAIQWIYRHFMK